MRTPFIRTARWLMLLVIASEFPAVGQVLSPTNATNTLSSAVALEVKVLAVPGAGLREAGVYFPNEANDEPLRPGGFAIVLPEGEAAALAKDPETVAIHSLRLPPKSGAPARFRVEARTPVTEAYPVNPPYFEVALNFEVMSRPVSQKSIGLSSTSVVQIRRGPGAPGAAPALLLQTMPIKHEVQVPEGKTILLGGFFTASDAARLPDIPQTPESPLLHYVLSKAPRGSTHPEIVVLLTPRLVESVENAPRVPLITETTTPPPAFPAPTAQTPVVATAATPLPTPVARPAEPKSVDLKPVISALVTTPEVVAPPLPTVTPRPAPPVSRLAAAPLAKRDTRSSYSVQVGAFRSSDKAELLVEKLENQNVGEVFVEEIPDASTPYRVRIGPLPSLAAANKVRQKLTKQGIDSFVVLPASR